MGFFVLLLAVSRNLAVQSSDFLCKVLSARIRHIQEQKREEIQHVMHNVAHDATPEQLDSMLEALLQMQRQGAGNIQGQESRLLLMKTVQNA